jgi:cytochrome P450
MLRIFDMFLMKVRVIHQIGTQEAKLYHAGLRLYPPVPLNARTALKDTTIPMGGGEDKLSPILIPKGTVVGYSVWAMHRRTDLWGPDAAKFVPERWEGAKMRGWQYLPFNGGPRICLGRELFVSSVL